MTFTKEELEDAAYNHLIKYWAKKNGDLSIDGKAMLGFLFVVIRLAEKSKKEVRSESFF